MLCSRRPSLSAVSGKALNTDASYLALANNPATASLQIVQANPAALVRELPR